MNDTMNNSANSEIKDTFKASTYFEDIGAWPAASHKLGITYVTGFVLSIILTLAAYFLATHHALSTVMLIAAVVALAAIQFVLQMVCFLHLGSGRKSRDQSIVLGFTAVIIVILVVGSLWIMNNLNQRMMPTTAQMEQYMNGQTGI